MWYFVVFQPSKCKKTYFSLKFDQFDPISPMTQKVGQKSAIWNNILSNLRNSELAEVSANDVFYQEVGGHWAGIIF